MIESGKILMNITAFLNVYGTVVAENGRMTLKRKNGGIQAFSPL